MDCGCKVFQNVTPWTTRIEYCPMHQAAPELLEACRIAIETFDDNAPGPGDTEKGALRRLRAAIAKAEGK